MTEGASLLPPPFQFTLLWGEGLSLRPIGGGDLLAGHGAEGLLYCGPLLWNSLTRMLTWLHLCLPFIGVRRRSCSGKLSINMDIHPALNSFYG